MIVIEGIEEARCFFKDLLCLPKRFVRSTSCDTDQIVFREGIDKEELYRDLQNWMELRRHEL